MMIYPCKKCDRMPHACGCEPAPTCRGCSAMIGFAHRVGCEVVRVPKVTQNDTRQKGLG